MSNKDPVSNNGPIDSKDPISNKNNGTPPSSVAPDVVPDLVPDLAADRGMASAMTKNAMIKKTYEDPPTDELMQIYAAWATEYDSDLIDGHGYRAPHDAVAGFLALNLDKDARILDVGCGTGMVGLLLRDAGFTTIDGADLSDEMRDIAASHGVYQNLFALDMTADYNIATPYDAVICVGVFGFGPPHVPHLHLIMDAAKPNAPVMVTVNGSGWSVRGWDESFAPHLAAHDIRLIRNDPIRHMVKDGINARLIELRRG